MKTVKDIEKCYLLTYSEILECVVTDRDQKSLNKLKNLDKLREFILRCDKRNKYIQENAKV